LVREADQRGQTQGPDDQAQHACQRAQENILDEELLDDAAT